MGLGLPQVRSSARAILARAAPSYLALARHSIVSIQRDDGDERRVADRVLSNSITYRAGM